MPLTAAGLDKSEDQNSETRVSDFSYFEQGLPALVHIVCKLPKGLLLGTSCSARSPLK
jgi:hypothetical protein